MIADSYISVTSAKKHLSRLKRSMIDKASAIARGQSVETHQKITKR